MIKPEGKGNHFYVFYFHGTELFWCPEGKKHKNDCLNLPSGLITTSDMYMESAAALITLFQLVN